MCPVSSEQVHGEIALAFLCQGSCSMTRKHAGIREELVKHSWISSSRVSSEIQSITESVMWRSVFANLDTMRLRDTSAT